MLAVGLAMVALGGADRGENRRDPPTLGMMCAAAAAAAAHGTSGKDFAMAKYVVLVDWTDQGVRNAKDTVDRFEQAREAFQQLGVTFDTVLWTLGRYDIVAILDAPDDATLAVALLRLAGAGNVSTETLRGFTPEEVRDFLAKLG